MIFCLIPNVPKFNDTLRSRIMRIQSKYAAWASEDEKVPSGKARSWFCVGGAEFSDEGKKTEDEEEDAAELGEETDEGEVGEVGPEWWDPLARPGAVVMVSEEEEEEEEEELVVRKLFVKNENKFPAMFEVGFPLAAAGGGEGLIVVVETKGETDEAGFEIFVEDVCSEELSAVVIVVVTVGLMILVCLWRVDQ